MASYVPSLAVRRCLVSQIWLVDAWWPGRELNFMEFWLPKIGWLFLHEYRIAAFLQEACIRVVRLFSEFLGTTLLMLTLGWEAQE